MHLYIMTRVSKNNFRRFYYFMKKKKIKLLCKTKHVQYALKQNADRILAKINFRPYLHTLKYLK